MLEWMFFFGGTKNGMMYGEGHRLLWSALSEISSTFENGVQLASKMRFISAQFDALLSNDLWRRSAQHANQMAARLAQNQEDTPIRITRSQGERISLRLYLAGASRSPKSTFLCQDETTSEVRWMTSFDTTEEDIEKFIGLLRETVR
jgi:threonine aldolase